MFKLNEKYQSDRRILKCDFIRYPPSEISTINTPNSQLMIKIPRRDTVNSVTGSRLSINFDVLRAATEDRYTDGDNIRLVNLGPIALFNIYNLATSSGKLVEEVSQAHTVCLTYKLLTSVRDTDDLSIGFDRDRGRREREIIDNKNLKGNFHVTITLKDIVSFAEHQEKGTYGIGHKLMLPKNNDSVVLNKGNANNNAKIKINSIDWYVPHYTPSLEQQTKLSNQIVRNIPTELKYTE